MKGDIQKTLVIAQIKIHFTTIIKYINFSCCIEQTKDFVVSNISKVSNSSKMIGDVFVENQ